MTSKPTSALPSCPHGDATCPCPDGDTCNYEDAGPTLAWECWSPFCTVAAPHPGRTDSAPSSLSSVVGKADTP